MTEQNIVVPQSKKQPTTSPVAGYCILLVMVIPVCIVQPIH